MHNAGLTIGLGTDGITTMFEAMRIASVIHKGHLKDPTLLPPEEVFSMATSEGADAIGYGNRIGSLEPGKKADVVILTPKPTVPLTPENAISQLVLFGGRLNVETVIVDGTLVMRNGKMLTVDEEEVFTRSREVAAAFWEKLKKERNDLPHPQPYRC
jgi:5-methylthioadenosine/S-adenosylhomocysteine deaminase